MISSFNEVATGDKHVHEDEASTALMPLNFLGIHQFGIADLTQVPWPTSTGGNTSNCPLSDFTADHYRKHHRDPTACEVVAYFQRQPNSVAGCWHHRHSTEEIRYIAELSCWFVRAGVQPVEEAVDAVVARDDQFFPELAADVYALFVDPIRWSFQPGAQMSNGRHRTCAFKTAGVQYVAVAWVQ